MYKKKIAQIIAVYTSFSSKKEREIGKVVCKLGREMETEILNL